MVMKEFTPEELAGFNGQDGKPAYVAYSGKVYDVSQSRMWRNGQHMKRHDAGADHTEVFSQAPHGPEVLERVTLAGALKAPAAAKPQSPAPETPAWADWLLGFHPHPIMVHFPQAFLTFAPVFLILFYLTGNRAFERTAFHLAVAGALMAVPAVLTGLFHWMYKYARASGGIYKFKIALSLNVLCVSAATVTLHHSRGMLNAAAVDYTVLALYVILVPLVASLGHAGGIIVFGRK